jgi:hypothetical protein
LPLTPKTVVLSQSVRPIMKILKLHNKNQGLWEVILVTFSKKKPGNLIFAVKGCASQEKKGAHEF